MVRLALVVIAIFAFAGCGTENDTFCHDNPGQQGCPMGDGSITVCKLSTDCKDMSFPVCDTGAAGGTCVACTSTNHGACGGNVPRCENDTCVACINDGDCGVKGVCLPAGGCATSNTIIHAASTSTAMNGCGDTNTACSLAGAFGVADSTRNVIKLDDVGPYTPDMKGFTPTTNVTIDARGSMIARPSGNGPLLVIGGGVSVTLLGGTIHGNAGGDAENIKCSGGSTLNIQETRIETSDRSGINADMCSLNLTQIAVANNSQKSMTYAPAIDVKNGSSITLLRSRIESNSGGGISVAASTLVIISNVLFNNGSIGTVTDPNPSPIGGMSISPQTSIDNRVEFNTIVSNHAQAGGNAPGIHCISTTFGARNNIIWNNNDNVALQTGGNCLHSYSDLGFVTVDLNNNMHADPAFGSDLHLKANSLLRGNADPNAILMGPAAKDIDGDPRRPPADIGADQYRDP